LRKTKKAKEEKVPRKYDWRREIKGPHQVKGIPMEREMEGRGSKLVGTKKEKRKSIIG